MSGRTIGLDQLQGDEMVAVHRRRRTSSSGTRSLFDGCGPKTEVWVCPRKPRAVSRRRRRIKDRAMIPEARFVPIADAASRHALGAHDSGIERGHDGYTTLTSGP